MNYILLKVSSNDVLSQLLLSTTCEHSNSDSKSLISASQQVFRSNILDHLYL